MSVAMTTEAVRNRTKTVTRRKGWWLDSRGRRILHAGDRLTLCEKVQGRRKTKYRSTNSSGLMPGKPSAVAGDR